MKQNLQARPKIIVLRGNSGSGKSTIANHLCSKITPRPIIIEQDHFRHVLVGKENDPNRSLTIKMMNAIIKTAFMNDRIVIIEGILRSQAWDEFLSELVDDKTTASYLFYFDVSLPETKRRHASRLKQYNFSVKMLENWYVKDDRKFALNEQIMNENMNIDQIVNFILKTIGEI